MKNKILTILLSLYAFSADAQWPVLSGTQGNITGTIGESRISGNSKRIHNGTDIDSPDEKVYSVQDDIIRTINISTSDANNHYIEMSSGIRYTHVNVLNSLVTPAQISQVNNQTLIVLVTRGQQIGTMIPSSANFGSHVHLSNSTSDNFLVNGFGSAGFTFVNNVSPRFGDFDDARGITFFKDKRAGQPAHKFKTYITDEGYAATNQPLVLWGPVDIVGNIYRRWIGINGNVVTNNRSAPFKLGYRVERVIDDQGTTLVEYDMEERLLFQKGLGSGEVSVTSAAIYDSILSPETQRGDPYYIRQ